MIKAIRKSDGGLELEVLGVPFDNIDADGEYFTKETDFLLGKRDAVPVLENHSMGAWPEVLGTAHLLKKDRQGLWFKVILEFRVLNINWAFSCEKLAMTSVSRRKNTVKSVNTQGNTFQNVLW